MTSSFNGKTVLVTGAAQGIGEAIARNFLDEGAAVIAADRSESGLREMGARLTPEWRDRLTPLVLDVTEPEQVARALAQVEQTHTKLDVLVNNAGRASWGSLAEIDFEEWRSVMSVSLDSVFLMSRAVLPLLMATKGNIVNVASVAGLAAEHRMAAYNAAKGAVVNLTRSIAYDFGCVGVRANAVAPGPVKTPHAVDLMNSTEPVRQGWEGGTPLGKIAELSDVSATVVFLASDAARHITGVILPVDGGAILSTGAPDVTEHILARRSKAGGHTRE